MEKENTAKSGTGMKGKMKDMCGGMMSDPKMMAKMKDCCGAKGFTPEMMEKWKNCCGSGEKKE
jgi:hypothetical protein